MHIIFMIVYKRGFWVCVPSEVGAKFIDYISLCVAHTRKVAATVHVNVLAVQYKYKIAAWSRNRKPGS